MKLFKSLSLLDNKHLSINNLPIKRDIAAPAVRAEVAETLPDHARVIRDERWQFCRAVVDQIKSAGCGMAEATSIVSARDAANFRHLDPKSLNYGNARRWLARLGAIKTATGRDYNWDNIAALADQYPRGRQPIRMNQLAWKTFCAMYLNVRRPTIRSAYREAKGLFLREFPDVVFPSLDQITYQLSKLPQNVVDAGRYGIDYVENRALYMIIRDWSKVRPNQCWFADSRPFDQLMRVMDDKGNWRATRPNVTFIMDAASWYCVGIEIAAEGVNSDLIRNAFARACVEHGRPEVLYVDNGADYNKAGFTTPVEIEGKTYSILQALDIHLTNSLPYRGRAKTVERRFQFFAIDFDRRQPSYLGNSPETRPDTAELYYKGDALMTLPTELEFYNMLRAEIARFHAAPIGGHLRGRTPEAAFRAGERVNRAPMAREELYRALLLPLPAPRKIHRGGCIDIARVRYYAPELEMLTGTSVIVKTSYLEPGQVHAYDLAGRYLCCCTAQSTTHPLASLYGDDDDRAKLASQMVIAGRQRREVMEALRTTTGGLGGLAIEDIKTLSRRELENGTGPVVVGSMRKVKGGTHDLKVVTVPERAAQAREEMRASGTELALRQSAGQQDAKDRQEFDEDFAALMAGYDDEDKKAPKQDTEDIDDFQL